MKKEYDNPNQINKPAKPKMYCKVCKSAGKPESVSKTHNVRNDKGVVVCSTLMSQSCKYCKEKGHTPKYCTKLQKKQQTQQKQQHAQENSYQQRAREICSSPSPPPVRRDIKPPVSYKGDVIPYDPTPIDEKPNYCMPPPFHKGNSMGKSWANVVMSTPLILTLKTGPPPPPPEKKTIWTSWETSWGDMDID
jgi:hypothetical protein